MPSLARPSIFAIATLLLVLPAFASEQDELREQAAILLKKAAIFTEKGRISEAEDMERRAKKLMMAAEDLDRTAGEKRAVEENHKKRKDVEGEKKEFEKKAVAEKGERKIAMKEKGDVPHEKELARRLEHARIAVDNLNAAGLHDLAKQAAASAEKLEQALRESQPKKIKKDGGSIDEAIEDLRHEIQQIRHELKSLEERIPRTNPFNLK